MEFKGIFPYPPMFHELADEIATLRSEMSKDVYKKGTEKYRGDREHEISVKGILGELIARDYLSLRPIKYKATRLVDFKPLVEPDIILLDVPHSPNIDVKCAKEGATTFYINKGAYENTEKKIDVYWFVKLERNCEASHYVVLDEEVGRKWELKELTYTEAYCKKIPEL